MAKFTVRSRKGPGDTFRKVGELEAPHKPDGSHFENVLKAHVKLSPPKQYQQYAVQHNQSGDMKTFRVTIEPVIVEV